jgi:hypothetical protein
LCFLRLTAFRGNGTAHKHRVQGNTFVQIVMSHGEHGSLTRKAADG